METIKIKNITTLCGCKTLDLNIILIRATNPRKAMKCGIYHIRVLVAVYSYLICGF